MDQFCTYEKDLLFSIRHQAVTWTVFSTATSEPFFQKNGAPTSLHPLWLPAVVFSLVYLSWAGRDNDSSVN